MPVKGEFSGTGGELFGKLIVGAILSMLTVGIYLPWYIVSLVQYVCSKTTLRGTTRGDLTLRFGGTGGALFVAGLVGFLLTSITFGIYAPWFVVNLQKYFVDNLTAQAADGTTYGGRFKGTGGEFLAPLIIGALLTAITFGIYAPWFACKMTKMIHERTFVVSRDAEIGHFDFIGTGGAMGTMLLVGALLTAVTFGIYFPWFQVKQLKFVAGHTRLSVGGQTYAGEFSGTGGEHFKIELVGALLTSVTLGIYSFWFLANLLRFQINHVAFAPAAPGAPAAAAAT